MAKLMTNIQPEYYEFIEKEANAKSISKRDVIEAAIQLYREKVEYAKMEHQYKEGYDEEYQKELIEWSELGLGDFVNTIDD